MGANECIKIEDDEIKQIKKISKTYISENNGDLLLSNYFIERNTTDPRQNNWTNIYRDQLHCIQDNVVNFFMYMYIVDCFATLRTGSGNSSDHCQHLLAKQKYTGLQKTQQHLQNQFYTKDHWNQALDLFGKAQRTYHAFNRLAHLWKLSRATFKIKEDLSLQTIDPDRSQCITIYQDHALYLFTLADLINVIKSALSNCSNFFVKPLYPRNPYTNRPFSTSTLLNIYLAIKRSSFTMPVLFHLFFLAEFDIVKYGFDNEAIIRDVYIKNYVKTTNSIHLFVDVRDMLKRMDPRRRIRVHRDFPKDILVNIMRPYLELYFTYYFSISNTEKKLRSYHELKQKLNHFITFNPQFGRRIMIEQANDNIMISNVLHFRQGGPLKKRPIYISGFNMKHAMFHQSHYHNDNTEHSLSDDEEDQEEEHDDNTETDNDEADEDNNDTIQDQDQEEPDGEEDDDEIVVLSDQAEEHGEEP